MMSRKVNLVLKLFDGWDELKILRQDKVFLNDHKSYSGSINLFNQILKTSILWYDVLLRGKDPNGNLILES